jgi:hypothetical protein
LPRAPGDLRSLVLGDHALHLDEQPRLRVVVKLRALKEAHRDVEALELLEHEHLVGVAAGEAVGAEADNLLDQAGGGRVTEAIERRPVEPRTRVALIDELADHLIAAGLRRPAE